MPEATPPLHVVPIPGMKESVEARLAPPGTLTYAQNVRFEKPGRIRKRGGAEQRGTLPNLGSLGAATSGSWLREDLACFDDVVVRYHEDSGTWFHVGNDTPITPVGRFSAQLTESASIFAVSSAAIGGVLVVASSKQSWSGSSVVRITGMSVDGQRLWETSIAGHRPRLLLVGSTLYCVFLEATGAGSGNIQYSTVSAAGTVSAPANLVTGSFTYFDVALLASTSNWLLATYSTLVTVRIMSGVSSSASNTAVAAGVVDLAVAGSGLTNDTIWVAWHDNTNLKSVGFKWDLSGSWTSTTTLFTGGVSDIPAGQPTILRTSSTTALVAVTRLLNTGSITLDSVRCCSFSTAGSGTVSRTGDTWGWRLASKFGPSTGDLPISTSTRARAWVYADGRHAVLDLSVSGSQGAIDGGIVGLSYEREAYSSLDDLPAVTVAAFGPDQRIVAFNPLLWASRETLASVDVVTYTTRPGSYSARESARCVQAFGPCEYIGGGAALLDALPKPAAVTFRYHALNGFPRLPYITGSATAGGSLTADTAYAYYPVYEHLDEAGQRVRSVGTPIIVTTTVANKTGSIVGAVPGATQRPGATLHLYRAWGGGAAYRVTPDSGAPAVTDSTGACVTAGYVSYADTMSDATAATHEELNIGFPGAALPPDPPSGARLLAQGDGRLFLASWDRRVVWVSKLWVPGEPAQFVDDDAFRIFFPEDLTALAYQDGALVAFSERRIYIVAGDGPTDSGTNEYPGPLALPVDAGCIDWRSVITTAAGTFYQSPSGIMLLPRGFGPPQFVGADVQDTIGANSELGDRAFVTGTAQSRLPNGTELVHFLFDGNVLTFDLRAGAWSVDLIEAMPLAAIGTVKNRLGALRRGVQDYAALWFPEDGIRNCDPDSTNADQWCEQRLRFGELRPFGICGVGRFNELVLALDGDLGVIQAACVLRTTLDDGFDVDEQPETRTYQLGSGGIEDGGASGMIYLKGVPAREGGTALGVELYDAQADGGNVTAASWDLFGFSIATQAEDGLRELPQGMVA